MRSITVVMTSIERIAIVIATMSHRLTDTQISLGARTGPSLRDRGQKINSKKYLLVSGLVPVRGKNTFFVSLHILLMTHDFM